ncbi:hypothetical protein PENCOP_c005G01102 [Penicillium coprophilum]|uniref:Uncharacterized protein n=1 Tax=Penicillium coprophilum TaxID=36646 RepID=A0A1V6UQY6_9EURO|nr:hypothetical protein PENCOP_c005G01102 [Penicillium coprophilum]
MANKITYFLVAAPGFGVRLAIVAAGCLAGASYLFWRRPASKGEDPEGIPLQDIIVARGPDEIHEEIREDILAKADVLICHVLEGFDHKTTTRVTTLQVTTAIPHMHDDFEGKVRRVREICTKIPRTIPPGSLLEDYRLNPEMLSDYLSFVTRRADDDINEMKKVSSEHDRWFEQNTPGICLTGQPSLPIESCKTLFALELASIVYDRLGDATISLGASLTKPLSRSKWVPRPIFEQLQLGKKHTNSVPKIPPMLTVPLNRQQAFSYVARFESGHAELDSEDSLYVAAVVLVDPFEQPEAHELRRIVGNIGHPGISVLIAPEEPRMRQPSNEHTAISHVSYDFQRENNFSGTSLHLSFTDWRLPLEAGGDRTIDQGVFVVEAAISVLDRGKWVADLDILCIDFEMLSRIIKECDQHEREDHDLDYDYTSIDNWDELLDTPEGVGIFRAHGNWAARLAASA